MTENIIEHALNGELQGAQVMAWRFMRIGIIDNVVELQELWQERDDEAARRVEFKVNVVGEGFGVGITRSQRASAVWQYNFAHTEREEDLWLDPRNLVTPALEFRAGEDALRIRSSAHSANSLHAYSHALDNMPDIQELSANSCRTMIYPALREDEAHILDLYGVYALHESRIHGALRVLKAINQAVET